MPQLSTRCTHAEKLAFRNRAIKLGITEAQLLRKLAGLPKRVGSDWHRRGGTIDIAKRVH